MKRLIVGIVLALGLLAAAPALAQSGGPGGDVIYGTTDNNVIHGGPGDDVIYARAGNDVIFTGSGHDSIYAGRGFDVCYVGPRDSQFGCEVVQ